MKHFYSFFTIKTHSELQKTFSMLLLIIFALGAFISDLNGQTVTTNKVDYSPGETVIITGSGWAAYEVLDLVITEDPVIHDPHVFTSVADGSGNFTNTEFVIQTVHYGQTFFLNVKGRTSGAEVNIVFTDGQPAANLDQLRNGPADSPIDPGIG
jgi:hypothetical protein